MRFNPDTSPRMSPQRARYALDTMGPFAETVYRVLATR